MSEQISNPRYAADVDDLRAKIRDAIELLGRGEPGPTAAAAALLGEAKAWACELHSRIWADHREAEERKPASTNAETTMEKCAPALPQK